MVDLEKLSKEGYRPDQIEEIVSGLSAGIDVSLYLNKDFYALQMHEIKLGLIEGLDVSVYADPQYEWLQMEQIRKGLSLHLDISKYARPDIEYVKMRQVRKGLEDGIDLSDCLNYSAAIIRQFRKARKSDLDISTYVKAGYDDSQINEIRLALEHQIDLTPYLDKGFIGPAIAQIRMGLENGIDVSVYVNLEYSWLQMREIRLGLENRIDALSYANPFYSYEQMHYIRIGLEQGLNVSTYATLMFPAPEMKRRYEKLLDAIKFEDPDELLKNQPEDIAYVMGVNREIDNLIEAEKTDSISISMDKSKMAAYIVINQLTKAWTAKELVDLLEENNIVKGVKYELINTILDEKNFGTKYLIAEGQIPRKGQDGWYEFFFRTDVKRRPKKLENGAVDYSNVEWYETVKEGDLLAIYHEAKEGENGYNICGEIIPARKGTEERMLSGNCFTLDDTRKIYRAAFKGMVVYDDYRLEIKNCLELKEVNFTTGNIDFDGNIRISGNVDNGRTIKATGDIIVEGTVGSAYIESGGSITLQRGVNAGGKGYIKAAGSVSSHFCESVDIECGGNFSANTCLNSNITTQGRMEVLVSLIGGTAYAFKGFVVNNVGNDFGNTTALIMGGSDELRREQFENNKKLDDVNKELLVLKKGHDDMMVKIPAEIRNISNMFLKTEQAILLKIQQLNNLTKKAEDIHTKLMQAEEVKAVIKGTAYEGTTVEINHSLWRANNEFNVIIKKAGSIIDIIPNN